MIINSPRYGAIEKFKTVKENQVIKNKSTLLSKNEGNETETSLREGGNKIIGL